MVFLRGDSASCFLGFAGAIVLISAECVCRQVLKSAEIASEVVVVDPRRVG
jgi:ABC-type cobalamin transport system permease subunit